MAHHRDSLDVRRQDNARGYGSFLAPGEGTPAVVRLRGTSADHRDLQTMNSGD